MRPRVAARLLLLPFHRPLLSAPAPLHRIHPPSALSTAQGEVTAEQKEVLKAVLRAQPHAQITPEIRRELFSAKSRGESFVPGHAATAAADELAEANAAMAVE